jgi:carbamoyltransferase
MKPLYILGTGLSHDGSACLLKNGRIAVAIEKERVTRTKHDGQNDAAAIRYCLDAAGITINDVDLVVQNANFGMFEYGSDWFAGPRSFPAGLPIKSISHHLAHAYSAVGPCPFEEAAVLIIDGCGNALDECIDLQGATIPEEPPPELRGIYFEKDSYYSFDGKSVQPRYKDFSCWGTAIRGYPLHPSTTRHSIGGLYLGASMYAFNGFEDAGKLMGLAPYGRPGVHDFPIFDLRDGRVFVRYDWMPQFQQPARSTAEFKANFQHYADLAYWVQKEVERAILYVVESRRALTRSSNLCYAGGVALNAVANRRVLRESGFREVFIQPAAGDNGLAIGCAYYGWLEILGRPRVLHDGGTCFGRSYSQAEVDRGLGAQQHSVSARRSRSIVEDAAELLANGNVIAWFQGRSEFGPRALGNRSILADPRRPDVGNFINSRIKFREDFRPFAPSVVVEEANLYFDCEYESPYMILVAPVRKEWINAIPAVVHKDGSARVQTVHPKSNPRYYALLRAFRDLTGIGVLLNTSLNRKRMPIVETPDEAMQFYVSCDLDALIVGDMLIQKTAAGAPPPATIETLFGEIGAAITRYASHGLPLEGVYQINISEVQSWTIDLSRASPLVTNGPPHVNPDVVIETTESGFRDFMAATNEDDLNRHLAADKIRVLDRFNMARNLIRILRFRWA